MSIRETLKTQRLAIPHLRNRTEVSAMLGVTPVHLATIEDERCFPSGALLEKLIDLLEVGPTTAASLWEELARHQLDPVVEGKVKVVARRKK